MGSEWVRKAVVEGKDGKKRKVRRLGSSSVEALLSMRLCWAWNRFVDNDALTYGTPIVAPQESYTSNTCLYCGEYKAVRTPNRYRRCPNKDCHAHNFRIHRELNACLCMIVAAACQSDDSYGP